jgi:hypothetical protein
VHGAFPRGNPSSAGENGDYRHHATRRTLRPCEAECPSSLPRRRSKRPTANDSTSSFHLRPASSTNPLRPSMASSPGFSSSARTASLIDPHVLGIYRPHPEPCGFWATSVGAGPVPAHNRAIQVQCSGRAASSFFRYTAGSTSPFQGPPFMVQGDFGSLGEGSRQWKRYCANTYSPFKPPGGTDIIGLIHRQGPPHQRP